MGKTPMATKTPRKRAAKKDKAEDKPAAPQKPRRWYSDDERSAILNVLATNSGDIPKTAAETGVPYHTIYAWVNGWRCPEGLQLYKDKKADLAHAAEEIAWQIAGILPDRLDEAPVNHLVTAFGVMVDKARLLRGEPTNINENQSPTDDAKTLREIVKRMTPDERQQFRTLLERVTGRMDSRTMALGT